MLPLTLSSVGGGHGGGWHCEFDRNSKVRNSISSVRLSTNVLNVYVMSNEFSENNIEKQPIAVTIATVNDIELFLFPDFL